MSRTVCSWCKAPLVLKDDILVCSNTDCPACDEKYLREELIRTRKALDVAKDTFNWIDETYRTGQETEAEIWGKVQLAAQEITATLENQNGNC